MQLVVDEAACDRCGTCIAVCPSDALVLTEKLSVDFSLCTRCGRCVALCPVGALALQNVS
jgi:ferredoxin